MKILIVGAGISGLSLARRLDDSTHEYTLIERTPTWSCDGAGICLPANAVAGLDKLGLKQKLLQSAHQVKAVSYVKPNGKIISSASLLEEPFNQQPFLALPRVKLLELLRQGMETKVRFGVSVKQINQYDEIADVEFDNGDSELFDLVVAADGINSQTRHMSFENPELEDLGVTNWRFLIEQDTQGLDPTYYLGSDNLFMRYPMPDNKVYCYAHILDETGKFESIKDKKAWLRRRFSGFDSKVVSAIECLEADTPVIQGRLKSVTCRDVYSGKVVLIGDALHGCPPTLQQGVGMGLEDAHCLADLLKTHKTTKTLLPAFKAQRLAQISWVIDESNRVIRLAGKGRTFIGRIMRNMVLRKTGPANVNGWRKLLLWDKDKAETP
ncbi:FAD-dependent monooxygenase [Shewanella violacea]|uniref:Monooxygenase family protein n=1 Tax=Shewanella violacea (strain JCM 10179 / CIP 106290 / LMG 19151 / DSS12) TaxID=637905 RepID=D4ZKH2_SHEVD|nr:FAD-dependent monooxygenase [Shewanella violacea]BAJ02171.1 monooxygenase family protein [Shewanella violacea DSS12]